MHFLQSPAWQAFQKQLGRKTFRQTGEGWEYLAILEHGTGNTRLYCPYGPTVDSQKALEEALESLISLGKQHNATFLRIEPPESTYVDILKKRGWRHTHYQSLNPEHSRVIDLTSTEEDIIANMAQPVRNWYRNYQKKGLSVKASYQPVDIAVFLKLIHQVAERTGMRPHSDEYFRAQADALLPAGAATLWIATFENTPIAAALIYNGTDTIYYAHAAASSLPEHRKLNAPTALLAEVIIAAKRYGYHYADLYGVAPENSSTAHPWSGFSKFKRSFGGTDVQFGGTWELPLRPLAYWMYRIYQTVRRYF